VISAGGEGRVLIWDPRQPGTGTEMACSAIDIAFAPASSEEQPDFVLAHAGYGISGWSLALS
jgi:hypothetical protein